jgi:hypothetical protein
MSLWWHANIGLSIYCWVVLTVSRVAQWGTIMMGRPIVTFNVPDYLLTFCSIPVPPPRKALGQAPQEAKPVPPAFPRPRCHHRNSHPLQCLREAEKGKSTFFFLFKKIEEQGFWMTHDPVAGVPLLP